MPDETGRVAQVFVWKQGSPPDLDYARQVLRIANPDAHAAVSGDSPPLQLFSVIGPWPGNPWARALADMRAIPSPHGIPWTDTNYYDLSGWQGTDSRTGDRIFVVTAYRRAAAPPPEAFTGQEVQAPSQPQAQTPYFTQFPTGPLGWPPQQSQQSSQQPPQPGYVYPPYGGTGYGQQSSESSYPYSYNPATGQYTPLITGPLGTPGTQTEAAGTPVQPPAPLTMPDSYAPFYAGFGQRLSAALIDFFVFLSWVIAATAVGVWWASAQEPQPSDFGGWLGLYGPFLCGGLLIVMAYNVIGWTFWGRTLGKKLMGIKVVDADGHVPGFGRALLRMLGYFFSISIAGWGFILVALDARRQGLHDKIAETFVVPDRPSTPAPAGLPGYRTVAGALASVAARPALPAPSPASTAAPAPAIGMATVSVPQSYGVVQVSPPAEPGGQSPQGRSSASPPPTPAPPREEAGEPYVAPTLPASGPLASGPLGPVSDALITPSARDRPDKAADVEKARALFKSGLAELERGARRGYSTMEVEAEAARAAAAHFQDALQLVPSAVMYRYFNAVALRYSEGFDVAIGEFRQVLALDPGHYEARQQVAFGPRWHDAFAYPAWSDPAPVDAGMPLPEAVRLLLPQPQRPGTRLVLLREGSSKMVVALSRTRRDTWAKLPTPDMPARIELVLTRTPSGPIIAFYVVVSDDPNNPYKGETFLNPHDPGHPSDDACQLGQHMLTQLARQDHTYLIFVDESDHLLLARKLVFDAPTQVNIAQTLYDVQTLPPIVMDSARFQQAAQHHMEHFSLDQIKP